MVDEQSTCFTDTIQTLSDGETHAPQLVLASASPRRHALLKQIGIPHIVYATEVEEYPKSHETPEQYVYRVAAEKSLAVQKKTGTLLPVLAADTEVVLDGSIVGKPQDREHAISILSRLSGRKHEVLSAVSLRLDLVHRKVLSRTTVLFRPISRRDIEAYCATGEPEGKAGGYAIQGRGAIFVEHLSGSYSGVVGLPLFETTTLLESLGLMCVPT